MIKPKPFISPVLIEVGILKNKFKREFGVPIRALELNEEEKENFEKAIFEARHKDRNAWEKAIVKRDEARAKRLKDFQEEYLKLPKNIRKSFNEGLLTYNELDTLPMLMRQQYFNAYNIPELHAFYLMADMHDYQKDLPPTKLNRERFFNALKARQKAERDRVAKQNAELKLLKELEDKIQKDMTILGNPFSFGGKNIIPTGGGLLSNKDDIPKFPEIKIKFSQPNTLRRSMVARRLQIPERKKADLEKREPTSNMGLNKFMKKHNLVNPVEFAKVYPKNMNDYKVNGHMNIRDLCDDMNVSPKEALLYICEGVTSTDERWKSHRMEKETLFRDSQSIVNIIKYYYEKVAENKEMRKTDKSVYKYTIKSLWSSDYVANIFKSYKCTVGSYSQFTRWFNYWNDYCKDKKLI